jgi:membrane-associated protease RseP (regulator of RpoE activity)
MMRWIVRIGGLVLVIGIAAAVAAAIQPGNQEETAAKNAESADAATVDTVEAPAYWLGIECRPVPPVLATQLALPEGEGVYVESVVPESPAAKAEILRHDILLKAGGAKLDSVPALVDVVAASEGKPIALELIRAGKRLELEVTPGERPVVIRDIEEDNSPRLGPMGEWLDVFGGGMGGRLGPRFRVLHPGVILPGGAKTGFELDEGTAVTIIRRGNQPAEIKVQRNGETYETTEDDLDMLPEDLRGTVESMLGGPFQGGGNVLTIGPKMGASGAMPSHDEIRKEMERFIREMNRDMEEMRRRMQELVPAQPQAPAKPKGSF